MQLKINDYFPFAKVRKYFVSYAKILSKFYWAVFLLFIFIWHFICVSMAAG